MRRTLRLAEVAGVVTALLALAVRAAEVPAKPAAAAGPVVSVRTDRPEAVYRCGETATFEVQVREGDAAVTAGSVEVQLLLDGGRVLSTETLPLGAAPVAVHGTLADPGFILCRAAYKGEGKTGQGLAGAAFEPERIRAATETPADFEAFWRAGQAQIDAIPIDVDLKPLPEHSDARQESFRVSFANVGGTRAYGFLSVPKAATPPFPAYVTVPGAGPGPEAPGGKSWAAQGALALCMSVHAYDCGLPKDEIAKAYAELNRERMYPQQGAPDRDAYYFRRAYLGIDRAVRWLTARPDWDDQHLVVDGSSQGGASALILAGLNPKVTAAAANVPALCDHAAGRAGRQPGWPGLAPNAPEAGREAVLRMSAYFDAVSFARRITCPVIASAGFVDRTCPPGSVYAAFNEIRSPKRMFHGPTSGHEWVVGEFRTFQAGWVAGQLGLGPAVPPVGP